ncbi:N-acyl homoserine lactonase family protein [Rhodococcus sp. IEGM 1366]|uniref:N-acyl homoserine lactonase family protein n=1 Tax=Rhodococcus sp. IEGM 1366 TaxID=3082223 RepID=UPI0029531EA5|nr:N-acyl homoserine lactonase family protein [Rhodococcus sp. IEGM 1366]MDV8070914.1 N-acyl homoserine lactonase family protein [Rhodococcus sp. IEGM 1366]
MTATYEVIAIRLGHVDRVARDNFLNDPHISGSMRLDFDMWVLRSEARTVLVDTGFSPEAGKRRGRVLERHPVEALRELGIEPDQVTDVVITHLHYDHAGNLGDFPDARIWIQRAEVAYATGGHMRHPQLSHFFEVDDVCDLVRRTFDGRVRQIEGAHVLSDGIELHQVGGHTPGLQIVRVHTDRGWVVLASDALHYYANLELKNPFPAIVDVPAMLGAFATVVELADSPEHLVPGHDPDVMERYGNDSVDLPDGMVALHRQPTPRLMPSRH